MKKQVREEPKIIAAAERQMQAWAKTQELDQPTDEWSERHPVKPYLAISREAGAGGSEIAVEVGAKLGWDVFDKNLLDRIAKRYQVSRPMLDLVDETGGNWVEEILGGFVDPSVVSTEKYVSYLKHVMMSTVRQDSLVLVGRGAQFLLPPECGVAVRIIASRKYRIARIMESERLAHAAAERHIDAVDAGRREFAQRLFHHDIDDPHLYHLLVNVERLGFDGAVDEIMTAVCCAASAV